MEMNESMKQHFIESLDKGIRFDGRKPLQYRNIKIEYGISNTAEGSARVKIGKTEVLAGVKLGIMEPYSDTPDEGTLMVETRLSPMSNPEFEGFPDINSIEIARIVDRGIRESKAIDMKRLCIKKGEKVWSVSIDIVTINDDGNLIDASALASIAAIKNARFPEYDGENVDYKHHSNKKLPIKEEPIAVTVYKIGDKLIVDPTPYEEKAADTRLTVTSIKDESINALQKGGDSPLTEDDINNMVSIALEKAKKIRVKLEAENK